jgi:hypothetical protein
LRSSMGRSLFGPGTVVGGRIFSAILKSEFVCQGPTISTVPNFRHRMQKRCRSTKPFSRNTAAGSG